LGDAADGEAAAIGIPQMAAKIDNIRRETLMRDLLVNGAGFGVGRRVGSSSKNTVGQSGARIHRNGSGDAVASMLTAGGATGTMTAHRPG
jgi:hypothetical protein